MKELENPRIESKVNSFVEKGNELHDDKKYAQALEQYEKAWSILPETKPEWQVANWISANIFSAYFDLGDYNEAKKMGRNDVANERVGDRYSAIDRSGYGLL